MFLEKEGFCIQYFSTLKYHVLQDSMVNKCGGITIIGSYYLIHLKSQYHFNKATRRTKLEVSLNVTGLPSQMGLDMRILQWDISDTDLFTLVFA